MPETETLILDIQPIIISSVVFRFFFFHPTLTETVLSSDLMLTQTSQVHTQVKSRTFFLDKHDKNPGFYIQRKQQRALIFQSERDTQNCSDGRTDVPNNTYPE